MPHCLWSLLYHAEADAGVAAAAVAGVGRGVDVNTGGRAASGVSSNAGGGCGDGGGTAASGVSSNAGGGCGDGGGTAALTRIDGKSRTTILSMAALKVGQNSRCLGWVRNEVMASLSSNVIEKTCVKPCVSMSWPSTSCPLSKAKQ